MIQTIKKSIVWAITFSLTTFTIFVVYALVDSTWTTPSTLEVWTGSGLSATAWNKLLSNFNNLNSRAWNLNWSASYYTAGNVGIWTNAPWTKLQVIGNTYIGGYSIGNAGGDYPTHGYNLDWSTATNSVTGVKYRLWDSATAIREQWNFQFFTAPAGTAGNTMTLTERMRIESNGNVGIWTTTPWTKLEVAGQIKITGGTPGTWKVLTSDASGLATWQTPSWSSVSVIFNSAWSWKSWDTKCSEISKSCLIQTYTNTIILCSTAPMSSAYNVICY